MNRRKHLIVGDGDFSYSVSQLGSFPEVDVITSCIELEEVLYQKYENASGNVERINQAKNWQVVFSVDATELDISFPELYFSHIQFNFPHCGGKSNIKRNRRLLQDFFQSARVHLKDLNSFVSIALCRGQGGTVFDGPHRRIWGDCWQVQEAAAAAGLLLANVEPFVYGPAYCPTGFRSQARRFGTEGSLIHYFRPSYSPVEVSGNPMLPIEQDLVCLRNIARLHRMQLAKLEGHPFQRICRRLLSASGELCEHLVEVSLPTHLPLEDKKNFPSSDNPFTVTSSSNPLGPPVAVLPASPFCLTEKLPMNSAGTAQCFQRTERGGAACDWVLVLRVALSLEPATEWTRSSLSAILPSWRESENVADLPLGDGKRRIFCAELDTSSRCVAFVLSRDENDTLLCFFLDRLAAFSFGLCDSGPLQCDDPRLLVAEAQLKVPLSLDPREFLTDMSFWLPTDKPFNPQSFTDSAFALSDGTLQSCDILERYERPTDGRVSHCYRLVFRSLDRALCQGTMHQLQSKLRLFSRDNFGVELR